IFLPLVIALVIPSFPGLTVKKRMHTAIGLLVIQFIILLPIMLAGDLPRIWKVLSESIGYFPKISMNAYNIWTFLVQGNLMQLSDEALFWGITYRNWGLLMFFATGAASLLWIVNPLFKNIFRRKNFLVSQRDVLITGSLIPLLFFFLNTQMHERYSHSALIFLAAYALMYNRIILLVVGSIAVFLNLEGAYRALELSNYHTLIFQPQFVASLFLLVIVWLFADLYRVPKVSGKELQQD
ncbi:MAG: hypothetical protein R6V49_02805, partial [Bacteroidales bacterium]